MLSTIKQTLLSNLSSLKEEFVLLLIHTVKQQYAISVCYQTGLVYELMNLQK